jgi:DNA-binding transcriptional MerR regulator
VNLASGQRELRIPAKRYRIGELVRYSPFSRQTIHNYTIMGLIREAEWTEGGHRLYDESVFDRLSRIIELRKTKSLREIRRILSEEDGITPPRSQAGKTDARVGSETRPSVPDDTTHGPRVVEGDN